MGASCLGQPQMQSSLQGKVDAGSLMNTGARKQQAHGERSPHSTARPSGSTSASSLLSSLALLSSLPDPRESTVLLTLPRLHKASTRAAQWLIKITISFPSHLTLRC